MADLAPPAQLTRSGRLSANQSLVWTRGHSGAYRVRVAVGSSGPRGRLSGVDIKPEALRHARTSARLSLSQVAGNAAKPPDTASHRDRHAPAFDA
jgi:hypothetical protein